MYLVMWTHVRDYDDWKAIFDSGERVRREFRCTGHEIFRDVDDPNRVTILLEFPTKDRAKAFLEEPRLQEKMRESGIDGEVSTSYVYETQRVDYRSKRAA